MTPEDISVVAWGVFTTFHKHSKGKTPVLPTSQRPNKPRTALLMQEIKAEQQQ